MTKDELMARVSRELARQGVSKAKIAGELGMSRAAVSHWVAGKNAVSLTNFVRFADALGMEVIVRRKKR